MAIPNFPGSKYPDLFVIYVMPAKGVPPDSCEKVVYSEITRMASEPIPADKLGGVKTRAKAQMIDAIASRSDFARYLAQYQVLYGDWRQLFTYLDRLNSVTADDIQRLTRQYLVRENRTVAYMETENKAQ